MPGAATDKSAAAVLAHHAARDQLLQIPFVSLGDYLWLLRALTCALAPAGTEAIVYLAAAVSDFYLPAANMAEHKIQSGHGGLHLDLAPVPKMIKRLVTEWCPAVGRRRGLALARGARAHGAHASPRQRRTSCRSSSRRTRPSCCPKRGRP